MKFGIKISTLSRGSGTQAVGLDNDLSRVFPAELFQLRHPLMRGKFKR